MKKVLSLLFIYLMAIGLSAQEPTSTLRGKVVNAKNNEPVPFASVQIWGTTTGAITDFDGNFLFKGIKPGYLELRASSVGFKPYISEALMVTPSKDGYIEIALEENVVGLEEVVIKASPFRKKIESPVSVRIIGIDEIDKNPGGNRDISKVIQSFPGVASTPAFRNDVIIRGGGPNENSFYIDNVEIPYLNHFSTQGASGGPVGIINVDFVREVDFFSGAFPASRGNALSSVLNFSLVDGNKESLKYRATVGASDLGLTVDGPVGERGTLIMSARRSYLQFLFNALGLPFLPSYNDFQFKYKVKIDTKNEITILGLGALDDFALNKSANETEFQRYILDNIPVQNQYSYTVGAVWKRFRDNGYDTWVISRNYLNNRQYKYQGNVELDSLKVLDYASGEGEMKLRYERTASPGNGWRVSYGAGFESAHYRNETFRRVFDISTPTDIQYSTNLWINQMSFSGQLSKSIINERLTLSFGLRTDFNDWSDEMSNPLSQLSPRLSASFSVSDKLSLNFNTGRYFQLPPYTALGYSNGTGEFINKVNGLKYITSDHIVGGIELLPGENIQVSAEAFYKKYNNYPFSVRDSVPLSSKSADYGIFGDESLTPDAIGRAYGIELLGRIRDLNGTNLVASYTLVRSEFKGKDGLYLPTAWDNRHLFNITVNRKFKKNWDVGLKWRFVGGAPYTPFDLDRSSLKEAWDLTGQGYPDYSLYNSRRLKAFHQLDFRVDKQYFFKKWSLMLYFDIQNLYNHQADQPSILLKESDAMGNPITDPSDSNRYLLKTISGQSGTVLPTIGIIFEI